MEHNRHFLHQKAQELHVAAEERMTAMERAIHDRDLRIADLQQKLNDISRDFEFNLGLIRDRDAELSSLESQLSALKMNARHTEADIADVRATCSELDAKLKAKQAEMHDLSLQHQEDLTAVKHKSDVARHQLEQQLRRKDDEIEALRREGERAYREGDERYEKQRIGLLHTLEQQYSVREGMWKKDESGLRGALDVSASKIREREGEVVHLREQLLALQLQHDKEIDKIKAACDEAVSEAHAQASSDRTSAAVRLRELESKAILQLREHDATVVLMKGENASLQRSLDEVRAAAASASDSHMRELADLRTRLEAQLLSRDEALRTIEVSRAALQAEVSSLTSKAGEAKWERVALVERCAVFEKQLEGYNAEITAAREATGKAQQETHDVSVKLSQSQAAHAKTTLDKEHAEASVQRAKEEVSRLQRALKVCEELNKQQLQQFREDTEEQYGNIRLEGKYYDSAFSARAGELEAENDKLQKQNKVLLAELRACREDLEYAMKAPPAPSHHLSSHHIEAGPSSAEKSLRKEISRLEHRLDEATSTLQGGGGGYASTDPVALRMKMTDLTKQAAKYRAKYERAVTEIETAKQQAAESLVKLHEAQNKVNRLEFEKEKLMDVSNMLRADLTRVMEATFYKQQQEGNPVTNQPVKSPRRLLMEEEQERENERRFRDFEVRQQALQTSVSTIQQENEALRQQLVKEREVKQSKRSTSGAVHGVSVPAGQPMRVATRKPSATPVRNFTFQMA